MRLLVPLILAAAMELRALPASAACGPLANASGVCTSMQGNTCFIDSKQCTVAAGAVLDFGTKDVVLRQGSVLDVGTGAMTITAKSLTLQFGTALLGHGGSVVVQTEGPIAVLKPSQGAPARIDVSDPVLANRIDLTSTAGTIQIDGILDARGTNPDGSGGSIDMAGANVLISGEVRTSGGNLGIGGPVSADAKSGSLTIAGMILGLGGSGGAVDLTADGGLTVTGTIDIRSNSAGGDGGIMTVLTTSGSITLGGKVFMQGDEGTDLDGGGNGGELNVFSAAGLTLSAAIEISGAPPDGQGGDVFFMSVLDTVQTGSMLAQGRGAESDGGSVEFESHKSLTLRAIDVHGGESLPDSGGAIQALAWCDLTVPSGVTISAEGDKGNIHLLAGGQIITTGALKAGSPILLEYRTLQPITAGGTFLPELATPIQNLTLTPCGGFTPPGCGDGSLDEGEQCDPPPGNTESCDGCSQTCQLEVCGNDVVDCGEACDDGNTTDGDGCHGDCSRVERCGDGIQDGTETCDDGNTTPCDGCSATCQDEGCGNATVECGEECEPPGVGGCSADCKTFIPPGCGDGTKVDPEECDDGNVIDGDGCSHQCREERCGNGTLDPHEACDDFNTNPCDGCSATCQLEICGNGVLDCGEECDDGAGNGAPGGSCLPDVCEPGPTCSSGGPELCIPCATTLDCDPLNACGSSSCQSGVCTPITPPSCDDHDVCNGVEICDPASGCKDGPDLVCDDDDACSTDLCDPVAGCSSTLFVGFALPECRLGTARGIVSGASDADIAAPIRTKLLKKLGGVEGKLLAADQAGDNAKKARKALKAAARQIRATVKFVTKQRGKKIATATADAILQALNVLPPLLTGLTP
jgi:cysteine-rich repeat protein